jgi:phosphomevalonate kinase
MVKLVLKWKQNKPDEAEPIWAALGAQNHHVGTVLQRLGDLAAADPSSYASTLLALSHVPAAQWEVDGNAVAATCRELHAAFCSSVSPAAWSVRHLLREMSYAAQVDIEPASQTALLDVTSAVPGVLFAGVPGAGTRPTPFVATLFSLISHTLSCINVLYFYHLNFNCNYY